MLLSIFNILAAKCLPLKYWSGQPSARRNITRGTDIENQDQQENYQEFLLSLVCLRLGLFEFFLLIFLEYQIVVGFSRFLLFG